jgi:methionyl-tRNA formyltransferase
MKIIFMGTPDFSVAIMRALVAAGHEIVTVYTQPPRPAKRGQKLVASAVQVAAEALGLAVRSPASLKGAEEQAAFAALEADVAVVAAYGLLLPQAVLDAPRLGCMNVHASLLPRWRGAAPVQRAILAGDAETGVTIMQMDTGLDTGAMRAWQRTVVAAKTGGAKTAAALTEELAAMGASLLVEVLRDMVAHPCMAQPDAGVTYAHKLSKSEARLDFSQPVAHVLRQIAAFHPQAYFEYAGERVRVLAAKAMALPVGCSLSYGMTYDNALSIVCADGLLLPLQVQRAGRGSMATEALLRGFPIAAHSALNASTEAPL